MASTISPPALPDGYKPAAVLVDKDHHGGWVHICNAFGLLVVLITLAIRVYIRTKVSPPFRYDDATVTAATLLATIQSGITFGEVHEGFGTSIRLLSETQIAGVQQMSYTADIFYILAIYAGKCSVVLLFMRMVADRMHQTIGWSMLASCCILGLISVFLTAIRCDVSQPWLIYGQTCSTLEAQSTAIAVFDILSELAIFSLSIVLVWGLYTKASNKSRVVIAFGIRLPVIAVIILRLVYLRRQLDSPDPTLAGAITSVLTQVELFYGIMGATVPCLRPFLAGFVTNYGAMGRDTVMGGSQIGTGSKNDQSNSKSGSSFVMNSLVSSRNRASALREKFRRSGSEMLTDVSDNTQDEIYRPTHGQTETTITRGSHPAGDGSSIGSSESTRVIIKKEVQFTVGSEQGQSPHLQLPPNGGGYERR